MTDSCPPARGVLSSMTTGVLETFGDPRRRLLAAVAAPIEMRAVLEGLGRPDLQMPTPWVPVAVGRWDLLLTGVSKSNAAGTVARTLRCDVHAAVFSLGIAGVYPNHPTLTLGQAVAGTLSILADDGVMTPTGFVSCADLGFPLFRDADESGADAAPADGELLNRAAPLVEATGVIATVSTCSGTNELSQRLAAQTAAVAEGMEGAAVGLVARRTEVPFLELRTISNTTGDRAAQVWNIRGALARLTELVARL